MLENTLPTNPNVWAYGKSSLLDSEIRYWSRSYSQQAFQVFAINRFCEYNSPSVCPGT
jgi:hypothetical protein